MKSEITLSMIIMNLDVKLTIWESFEPIFWFEGLLGYPSALVYAYGLADIWKV
jgi:hypothetical protein